MEELIVTIEVQAEIITRLRGQLREAAGEAETLRKALRTATDRLEKEGAKS